MELPQDNPLVRGLAMTREMLELAQAGEWESLTDLSARRLQLLRQWQADEDSARAPAYLGLLQEIQSLDRQLEALGRKRKAEVAENLRQIHQGRKAGKAYRG